MVWIGELTDPGRRSVLGWGHESAFQQMVPAARAPGPGKPRDPAMSDLAYAAVSVGFFVLCALYASFCEAIR